MIMLELWEFIESEPEFDDIVRKVINNHDGQIVAFYKHFYYATDENVKYFILKEIEKMDITCTIYKKLRTIFPNIDKRVLSIAIEDYICMYYILNRR